MKGPLLHIKLKMNGLLKKLEMPDKGRSVIDQCGQNQKANRRKQPCFRQTLLGNGIHQTLHHLGGNNQRGIIDNQTDRHQEISPFILSNII